MNKWIVTAVVIVFCILAVKTVKHVSFKARFKPVSVMPGAQVKGPLDAPVRIREFTDFQCPACSKAAPAADDLLKKYNGKISLEHKYFPIASHKNSMKASIFAECAAKQGKFWPYHDVLFKSQTSWKSLDDPTQYFEDLAMQLGLDDGKMMACIADKAAAARVNSDKIDGEIIGVNGTPTFVIDGKLFVGIENLKAELEARLGK
jgi:protein-disulfide isomerase